MLTLPRIAQGAALLALVAIAAFLLAKPSRFDMVADQSQSASADGASFSPPPGIAFGKAAGSSTSLVAVKGSLAAAYRSGADESRKVGLRQTIGQDQPPRLRRP